VRFVSEECRQSWNAFSAASTALSTVAVSAKATDPEIFPVAGLKISPDLSDFAG
jgi:hypothetical protein